MIRIVTALWIAVCIATTAGAQESVPSRAWDNATLRAFSTLAIQDAGRIKPLDTYASVQLLKFNGRRSCKDANGASLTPMEWFLNSLFFPEDAKQYKVFLVENADVMSMLSLPSSKERDRYSYNDLAPARDALRSHASQYSAIEPNLRTPAQGQLINLAHNIFEFEALMHYLDFARTPYPGSDNAKLSALLGNPATVRVSDVVANAGKFRDEYMRLSGIAKQDAAAKTDMDAMSALLSGIDRAMQAGDSLAIFPPPQGSEHKEWMSPSSLLEHAFLAPQSVDVHIDALRALERIAAADDTAAIAADATALNQMLVTIAKSRNEYRTIPLELAFYKMQLFWYSLYLYALSFIIVAVTWLRPKSRVLNWTALASVILPTILLSLGIALRCIIRSRPPVTTLYETILFITAVAVVVALFIEFANRQRVGLSLASILGLLGIFLANKYEVIERGDTMPSMVAVLDTNFWLSTHVTTVTMGYAAGLLASAIAHVYILGWALGLRKSDGAFYRSVGNMTYGVLCFGLLFATVGTVLGGIWANNSWGRFWGWDPKENGALMIVLWQIIVLHARLAHYISDFGTAMAAVAGGIIVAFSWFGVNLLGVGLHSYGFTSGIATALSVFYTIEVAVLFIGAMAYFLRPAPAARTTPTIADNAPVHVK